MTLPLVKRRQSVLLLTVQEVTSCAALMVVAILAWIQLKSPTMSFPRSALVLQDRLVFASHSANLIQTVMVLISSAALTAVAALVQLGCYQLVRAAS